ncbi:hypothetical protein GTY96_05700 [Corallococcus sp. c25j21]|nr:hypothetical protein [Corallococcus silvisoli]
MATLARASKVDVVIIGSGQAGVPLAVRLANSGRDGVLIARAFETGETAGLLKIIIDAADERVLGATFVGADAGELLHILVPLIQSGSSARAGVDAEFVHPTFAEGVQTLVMRLGPYALDDQTPPAPGNHHD